MSDHRANLRWRRETPDFDYQSYSRDHAVTFKNGETVTMSASPTYRGSAQAIDPEEMLVASIASCHMLTFLAIAARQKLVIDSYEDDAVGVLEKNADGKLAITRVTLRPKVKFSGGGPDADSLKDMHHQSHEACFIANSVTCDITIDSDS